MSRSCATSRCCCSCSSGTRCCRRLPAPRQALHSAAGVFLSNRGIKLPALDWSRPTAAALALSRRHRSDLRAASRFADRRQAATGTPAAGLAGGARAASSCCRWSSGRRSARRSIWTCRRCAGSISRAARTVTPGIRRAADRAGDLHRRLHRRDRALRHPGGAAGPVGGRRRARPASRAGAAADRAAAGAAGDHPADDQPIPEPDQEQLARGRDRLPGHRFHRQHHAEPDRPGDRGHRHHHGGISDYQPVDQRCS